MSALPISISVAAALAVAASLPAIAAEKAARYPAKPIRLVVPLPPAGSTDIVARLVAQKYNEAWGQPVIVDNRPGAGTTIGSAVVARAAKAGTTPEEIERGDYAEGSPRGNALGRMVDAKEVAYVATFLASDKAASLTGSLIVANGGAGNAVYY